jgi:hypothetical protein
LEQELEDKTNTPTPAMVINQTGPTILEALETYLGKKALMDPATGKEAITPQTTSHIRGVVEAFQRTSRRVYLREVTGDDLVGYFSMLRTQANLDPADVAYTEKLRKRNVTAQHHYSTLRAFFKRYRIDIIDMLEDEQIHRCKGRVPEAYTEAELAKMWAVVDRRRKFGSSSSARQDFVSGKWPTSLGQTLISTPALRESLRSKDGSPRTRPAGRWCYPTGS